MTVRDRRAESSAKTALGINTGNAEANFTLAVVSVRSGSYEDAANRAGKALETSPDFAAARRLRSQALVGLFASEPYPPERSPETRVAMLDEAAGDLEKYLKFDKTAETDSGLDHYLNSIRFFADYYRRPGNLNPPSTLDTPDPAVTPLRITRKSPPNYPASARLAGVEGTCVLLVELRADGEIGHILVAKPVEDSLDRAAIEAARKIKFEPMKRNGVAESVVKRIEYSFAIF